MTTLHPLEQLVVDSYGRLRAKPGANYCLGLSGGVDSLALLRILVQLRQQIPIQLSAIHVNHGLSAHADAWQEFCRLFCQEHAIALFSSRLQVVKIAAQGLENTARRYRYAEYAKTAAEVMILAHHQDDQIETMLSQLIRGSDVHNIAAMHAQSQRGKQILWRPLLLATKAQISDYAQLKRLKPISDESNNDNQYLRNFLRNNILPQLSHYDPHCASKLLQSLSSLQNAAHLNDQLAEVDLRHCLNQEQGLTLGLFSPLSPSRQLNLLGYFIRQQQLALPSRRQLVEFCRQVVMAAPDRHPRLQLAKGTALARIAGAIVIYPPNILKPLEPTA